MTPDAAPTARLRDLLASEVPGALRSFAIYHHERAQLPTWEAGCREHFACRVYHDYCEYLKQDAAALSLGSAGPQTDPCRQLIERQITEWREKADQNDAAAKTESRISLSGALRTEADLMRGWANSFQARLEDIAKRLLDTGPPTQESHEER